MTEDAGALLLVAMVLPFIIVLLGMPLVLVVRFVVEIVHRL